MQRTLRWDGLLPNKLDDEGRQTPTTPEDLRAMAAYVAANRTSEGPFEIDRRGPDARATARPRRAAIVEPWREAGATWWVEGDWADWSVDKLRARIEAGPPQAEAVNGLQRDTFPGKQRSCKERRWRHSREAHVTRQATKSSPWHRDRQIALGSLPGRHRCGCRGTRRRPSDKILVRWTTPPPRSRPNADQADTIVARQKTPGIPAAG